jgi:hypothetical protein
MPLNFPSNPSLNDTYTLGDKKWVYDGKGWKLFSASFELVPIVYAHANGAFDQANSANLLAQAAFDSGNSTYTYANSGYSHANAAFDKANSANVLAQSAYDIAVTDVTSVSVTANNYGNSTIIPVMRVEANGRISSVSNVSIAFPVTSVGGNTGVVTNQNLLDSIKQVDGSGSGLDADLLDGQEGSYYLDWTNTTNKPDPVVTVTLDGDVSGTASATLSDLTSNTITITTTVSDNSHNHSIANVSGLQSALDAKYDKTGGTISGDVQISGNLIIVGNTVTHSANDFIVNDPIILLANNNVGNILDIGFVAHYEDGGANTKHTGLVRHVSTNTWYLFENYEPHIQETNVLNIAHPTLATSNIKANLFGNANTATTWQTARTITIGSTGKSVDGSGAVTWTLSEIGAQTSGSYVTTDTAQTIHGVKTFANNFIVTSNTVIANLNADLLDGQDGSYYSNATNINAGTLNASRLPTVGTAGTYGNSTHVPVITTDVYGRVSSVTNTTISFPAETDTLQSVTERGNTSNAIITLTNTTKTTSNTTGSLLVSGGIAVTGNVALDQIFFADGTSMNTAAFGSGGGGGPVGSSTGSNIYLAYNFGGF